jgi:hypothetical protein
LKDVQNGFNYSGVVYSISLQYATEKWPNNNNRFRDHCSIGLIGLIGYGQYRRLLVFLFQWHEQPGLEGFVCGKTNGTNETNSTNQTPFRGRS